VAENVEYALSFFFARVRIVADLWTKCKRKGLELTAKCRAGGGQENAA
jgi:hypothetical protein